MADLKQLREEFKKFDKKEQRTEHIRENHHLRSEKFIVENFKDLGIENKSQAEIIGRICRGHRKENLHDKNIFNPDKMYGDNPINVPLLAALLRIADGLDLTFERTPQIIHEHIPPKDNISKEEWERHLSISGVGLRPEDPSTIKCSSTCENPKIHRTLKRIETKINKELEDLPNHLHQYRKFRRDLPRKFLVEIEAKGYKSYDFKFSLQEKEIVNLLMGEKLYKRKEESIRELLKNSVDGCRSRKKILEKHESGYNPKIVFKLTHEKDKIIVTDNGTGMDEDIIERYFTKIGKSFYTSTEFLDKNIDITPVSELGIGILSCFMIANKIVVETKMDDSDPLSIEIDDISDYFFVQEGKRKNTGTSVTLFLKDGIIEEINLEKEIGYYARHLEFPVKVILHDKTDFIIKEVGFKPNVEDILGRHIYGYCHRLIEIKNDHSEGVVALLLKEDYKTGLKPEGVGYDNEKRSFLSNEGIFVDNI
ncbi:MAG: ATP-binding protein, partial [Candidatus Altiarchaeales archaeon]|nr:ATP-binding protein [Candidatus Altiarchaeales archaeon]